MKDRNLTHRELEAIRQIRNSLMHRGRTPSVRELMVSLKYQSPRSVAVLIGQLINKGILRRKSNGTVQLIKNLESDTMRAQTVDVPLVGTIACGGPALAEENIEAMIPVSTKLARPPHKYFLLKAQGDSMNEKGINDGDLTLVRQQATAENGDAVVALIDNEATIKEFHVFAETIILKPRSRNSQHKPIILDRNFQIQGIVVTSIANL
ncbi:MAG: transcriptional repressor LexA [Candidatus Omnitrophica bacterium]|nr:transcriptional repressor LexA [Candidatus Omnitrophota bacterium]